MFKIFCPYFQDDIAGQTCYKDIMFFCLDTIESQTVALTCPKQDLPKDVSIAKCCPKGEMIKLSSLGNSEGCAPFEKSWKIPINGHLYNSNQLINQSKLVFDKRWHEYVTHKNTSICSIKKHNVTGTTTS